MEQNNQRNSRKRLNSLILLVAFTAVMLIVSTYAWFSTQKNVTLSGLYGEVHVAEGLQISLDGSVWVNSIDFSDFDQDTTSWTLKDGVDQTTYFDAGTYSPSLQYPLGLNDADTPEDTEDDTPITTVSNVIPSEFLPVSTTGYNGDGIGATELKMYGGNVENNKFLTDIEQKTEESASGYFAFDVFVWNSSAAGATAEDILRLDSSSSVRGDNSGTGIEYTTRVAMALYQNSGNDISTSTTRSQDEVIAGTNATGDIKDIAIWEPNANLHTGTIVSTNNALTLSSADQTEFGLLDTGSNTKYSVTGKFLATDALPTYGLTAASTTATYQGKQTAGMDTPANPGDDTYETVTGIKDIYDWDATGIADSKLARQYTLQTTSQTFTEGVTSVNLVSTGKKSGEVEPITTGDTTFTIAPSQYHKLRIYVWIEGQDPDCINAASLGGGLTIDLGFSKPGSNASASTSAS